VKPNPNIGTEDEFELEFVSISPPDGESLWEYKDTLKFPREQVWTVVDDGGETESWYAEPGYHIVNVMGYMVTEKPWIDETKSYYWYFDDRDRYEITLSNGDVEYEFADDETDALERAQIYVDATTTIESITLVED
jgi:hypothetical protein